MSSGHPVYWDPTTDTAWTSYEVGTQWHETFFEDPTSLYDAAQLAAANDLAGVGIWALGMDGNGPSMLSALLGFSPAVKDGGVGPRGHISVGSGDVHHQQLYHCHPRCTDDRFLRRNHHRGTADHTPPTRPRPCHQAPFRAPRPLRRPPQRRNRPPHISTRVTGTARRSASHCGLPELPPKPKRLWGNSPDTPRTTRPRRAS